MKQVVVQIPAYREEPWADRLRTIAAQSPPEGWDAEFEAWVTLSPPRKCDCGTYQDATSVEGVETFEAPPGKLSTRNAAHAHAVEQGADVIVTWDADAPPLSEGTLAALLAPFEQESVVATNGNPRAQGGVLSPLVNTAAAVEDRLRPQLHGQLSAIDAEAWERVGPFDTEGVAETRIEDVRAEEEFAFRQRLAQHGAVVDVDDAVVLNDTRRVEASVGNAFGRFTPKYPQTPFYDDRGSTTFNPRDR